MKATGKILFTAMTMLTSTNMIAQTNPCDAIESSFNTAATDDLAVLRLLERNASRKGCSALTTTIRTAADALETKLVKEALDSEAEFKRRISYLQGNVTQVAVLTGQLSAITGERDIVVKEKENVEQDLSLVTKEKDNALRGLQTVTGEKNAALAENGILQGKIDGVIRDCSNLEFTASELELTTIQISQIVTEITGGSSFEDAVSEKVQETTDTLLAEITAYLKGMASAKRDTLINRGANSLFPTLAAATHEEAISELVLNMTGELFNSASPAFFEKVKTLLLDKVNNKLATCSATVKAL